MGKIMVEEGMPAPSFDLETDAGSRVRLRDLRGQKVVLYFYPKDDTSGCTTEACEFQDSLPRIEEAGAVVLGISPDSAESHKKFKAKNDLTFPLLVDEDHEVAEAYGTWKEKSMYGRKFWGVERSTFLVGEDGTILKVWRQVKPKGHAAAVAEELVG